jgi:hypothetical protein
LRHVSTTVAHEAMIIRRLPAIARVDSGKTGPAAKGLPIDANQFAPAWIPSETGSSNACNARKAGAESVPMATSRSRYETQ